MNWVLMTWMFESLRLYDGKSWTSICKCVVVMNVLPQNTFGSFELVNEIKIVSINV
jgi:hypothetical protein